MAHLSSPHAVIASGRIAAIIVAILIMTSIAPSGGAAAAPHHITAELPGLLADASVATVDSRTGTIYVIDQRIDQIQVFDPTGRIPARSIAARGDEPVALELDSFQRLLYVLYRDVPTVQVFDLSPRPGASDPATWRGGVALPALCKPNGFALDSFGHQLIVVGKGCGAATVVDIDRQIVSATIPGDFSDVVALDITRRVFFVSSNLTTRIRSFDADTFTLQRDVAGFGGTTEIILDLDHYRLFILAASSVLEWDVRDAHVNYALSTSQESIIDIDFDRVGQTAFLLSRAGMLSTIDRSASATVRESTSGFTRPSSMTRDAVAGTTSVLCPNDGVIRVAR